MCYSCPDIGGPLMSNSGPGALVPKNMTGLSTKHECPSPVRGGTGTVAFHLKPKDANGISGKHASGKHADPGTIAFHLTPRCQTGLISPLSGKHDGVFAAHRDDALGGGGLGGGGLSSLVTPSARLERRNSKEQRNRAPCPRGASGRGLLSRMECKDRRLAQEAWRAARSPKRRLCSCTTFSAWSGPLWCEQT